MMMDWTDTTSERNDPYRWHRLALYPLREVSDPNLLVAELLRVGIPEFFRWIEGHALQQIWREYLEARDLPEPFTTHVEALHDHARLTAAHQLIQGEALRRIGDIFSEQNIFWVVFKGADLRAWLYADPVLRPVSDLDLLVRPSDRHRAIECLTEAGYALHIDRNTASHEVSLHAHRISIDLHWHLFRPGRARQGLDEWLFEHREEHAGLPGLDATASLLVMLVHPAITKYLISPTSMLIHQVDQQMLIDCGKVDWIELGRALDRFGLRTAAWSSLFVLGLLTDVETPGSFVDQIRPGRLHQWYLQQWIRRAWISRHFARRWLVGGLFSLALQDSLGDAWRATMRKSFSRSFLFRKTLS